MRFTSHLSTNNLTFKFPNADKATFDQISFSLGAEKVGLVGRNGVGKSTLLRIIAGELAASGGAVNTPDSMVYVRQKYLPEEHTNVSDLLGVTKKLQAFDRIEAGELHPEDFELLNDNWDFQERCALLFGKLGLKNISLDRKLASLSGGEITRIALANAFFNPHDIVILDEPTNNLDIRAREALYEQITLYKGCLLIVSHDRKLLRLMDRIAELKTTGLFFYGGNHDHYIEEKNKMESASAHQLDAKMKSLQKAKENIQKRKQQHQKSESKGLRTKKAMIKAKGQIDKIELNSAKGQSEKTNKRIHLQAEKKLDTINKEITEAREHIGHVDEFIINMEATKIPTNKVVLELKDLCFSYSAEHTLIQNFNLTVKGPERIAITGKNGAGKSTLFKLILSELAPDSGEIKMGVNKAGYFDQHANSLTHGLSIMENFKLFNPEISEAQAWNLLAQFKFRKNAVFKKVADLSGGEKLRALLACILMSEKPSQLLLIDEPTNHLDFESMGVIEHALRNYKGAMLVISHDQAFLEGINAGKTLYI